MNTRRHRMRSWVFGVGVMAGAFWAGLSVQAQMDDVTMPGDEKKAPSLALNESEFKEWAAKPGAVVFDLEYKGLTEKQLSQMTSFWTYESQVPETPFIQGIGLAKDKCFRFRLPLLPAPSDEGLLECEGENAKALYLDLNGDGKLGKGEKFEPIKERISFCFVTPDFTATRADGKKVPFRLMARVHSINGRPQVLFSPFCFWEGKAKLGGVRTSLRLMDGNFDGSYVEFGRDLIRQVKTSEENTQPLMLYNTLSSLTCQDKTFYQLRLTGEGTKEKPLRAVLCKDTSPTGNVEVKMAGIAADSKLGSTRLVSIESPTILFDINGPDVDIPQGRYRMENGSLTFGKNNTSTVSFSNGPECRIEAGKTATVELGQPKLKVVALEAAKRYATPVEAKTSFPVGTNLYLDLKLVGKQGEEYGSINEVSEKGEYVPPAKPHLQIFGPDGKEVASSDLEFG